MLYMVAFTINIPPMLAYIPYMDPVGNDQQASKKPWFSSGSVHELGFPRSQGGPRTTSV